MAQEHDNLSDILTKMDKIATERYGGNAEDNIYSIYMHLNDLERIRFTRYSYRFIRAIMTTVNIECSCADNTSKVVSKVKPEDVDDENLKVTDKRELVRLKHKALIGLSQLFIGVLSILIIGILLLSFVSPGALRLMGSIGNVLGTIAGK